ncbi:MAG: SDR family NAD(P)-dependent oxidoreductase [Thermoleophilaceae bacterium]
MGMLDGRVALVTGGGNGLGRAIAIDFAAEGASVVVNDLGGDWHGEGSDPRAASRVVEEIESSGGSAIADHGDVVDSDAAARMVTLAVDMYGDLDIVVNAAGILRDSMLVSMSEDDWDAIIGVHMRGHFAVSRGAAAYWRAKSKEAGEPVYGRLFCFTSEAGLYGNPGQTNYAAAKGGIASFGITAAGELGRYGVTSNVIAPRARTRMTVGTFGDAFPKADGYDTWDPAFVAPVITFLASAEGGRYSGQILVVGGGVLQTITPYTIDHESKFTEGPPSADDVAAFLDDSRGSAPGPPPNAVQVTLGG